MANVFLNSDSRDVETAIMLEQAFQHDIGKAVAYTDGDRIFINTDDNLFNILPAYDHNMLKWLLWHERYHKELRHHNRFFRYLEELHDDECRDEFQVTKDEVNIIMDILVHDSLAKLFPELIETAVNNLAQMRNRNSLTYTFTTNTLEEMLEEYRKHKKGEDGEGEGKDEETEDDKGETGDKEGETTEDKETKDKKPKDDKEGKEDKKKGHGEGGTGEEDKEERAEDGEPDIKDDTSESPAPAPARPEPEHDKTDWSKLDDIDTEEFIDSYKADEYIRQINRLKQMKLKLGKLTETLNGLATTTKRRSYGMPSTIHVGKGVLMKGRVPGKTALYLCFDASGSMSGEMKLFKDIISKSIPQAMDVPTTWFSGCGEKIPADPDGRSYDYYKGKFKDFIPVHATGGYSDDGDRTIELCFKAEQLGYSPIGVTDGGGSLDWSKPMLKQLKRTVIVGQNEHWLNAVQRINPKVQIIEI